MDGLCSLRNRATPARHPPVPTKSANASISPPVCRQISGPVPVPMDDNGVRVDLLADAFGARVFYCQPLFHNPTGAVLATDRRRQVIEIAHAAGAFVIEDDYARRLGHGGPLPPPLVADDPYGTVVHVSSLTKPTSPNLRVGALVARGPVLERLRAIQVVDSFFVPRPL